MFGESTKTKQKIILSIDIDVRECRLYTRMAQTKIVKAVNEKEEDVSSKKI